jgi:hypothetical protein
MNGIKDLQVDDIYLYIFSFLPACDIQLVAVTSSIRWVRRNFELCDKCPEGEAALMRELSHFKGFCRLMGLHRVFSPFIYSRYTPARL